MSTNNNYTVEYLGQLHDGDVDYYETNKNSINGIHIPDQDIKVTWWVAGVSKTREQKELDLTMKFEGSDDIIIRVRIGRQTVAATLFDGWELKEAIKNEKFVICYHPYNLQAWKVNFSKEFVANRELQAGDKIESTEFAEKIVEGRQQALQTTLQVYKLLETMSKENTTVVNRPDTHGNNFKAPITRLPCTLSSKMGNKCKQLWPKQDNSNDPLFGVETWKRIEMPFMYTYNALEQESLTFTDGYYWPLVELVHLAFGTISVSKNISNVEKNPFKPKCNFDCLAEFLSLHVADPKNYKYTSDMCVKQVTIKKENNHQIFETDNKCKLEFEWEQGEMQERGNDPHDCEDIAAKTVMIFLTLCNNIKPRSGSKKFTKDCKEACNGFFDDKIAAIIALFLKEMAEIACESQIYMVTGMAGAPSIGKHYPASSENNHILNQYVSDCKLGGHEYAILCSKTHKKCTILETTGWTMVNVFNSSDTQENSKRHTESPKIVKSEHINKRMVCNVDLNKPGQQFWRNAFCVNDLLAFSTVGSSAKEMGLTEESARCVKCYSAPIEGILARLMQPSEYPKSPVSVDFLETFPRNEGSIKKMESLGLVYSQMNQPLISAETMNRIKKEKWNKGEIKHDPWKENIQNIRNNNENQNKHMIFSERKIDMGVPFMSGWLGWGWEYLDEQDAKIKIPKGYK